MATVTKGLKGGPELVAFLGAFPAKLEKAAIRAGLTAAAAPIRDQARANARKQSGKMARAIKTGSARKNQDGSFSVSIRLKGPHGFLGLFHEYGVKAHLIRVSDADRPTYKTKSGVVKKQTIRFVDQQVKRGSLVIGRDFVGPVVMHPGHSAHPFMRPALQMKADEAVQAFGERVRSYLHGKSGFTAPTMSLAA